MSSQSDNSLVNRLVLEDPGFHFLRSEIIEELEKPNTFGITLPESRIAEAMDYGIQIVTKSGKSGIEKSSDTFGLHEFLRSLKHQILNIGFQKDSDIVTKVNGIINETDSNMMVPMKRLNLLSRISSRRFDNNFFLLLVCLLNFN